MKRLAVLAFLTLSFVLSGCSSQEDEWAAQISQGQQQVEDRLQKLAQRLEAGHLTNATLLHQYASYIRSNQPDLAGIASTLEREASPQGGMYQGLKLRLQDVAEQATSAPRSGENAVIRVGQELDSIYTAADTVFFNDALADPLNVLADMSNGKLSRVGVGQPEDSLSSNAAQNYGAGAPLVGNPNYGQWQERSSGTSFWAFYGQYRLFSDLLSGPVYYSRWSRNRDFSYYSDYGRNYYTSPSQRTASQSVQKKTADRFAARGQRFSGPYQKNRSQGKTFERNRPPQSRFKSVTQAPSRTGARFSSAYGSSGTSSKPSSSKSSIYNSRGSYSSSRSFGGGGK